MCHRVLESVSVCVGVRRTPPLPFSRARQCCTPACRTDTRHGDCECTRARLLRQSLCPVFCWTFRCAVDRESWQGGQHALTCAAGVLLCCINLLGGCMASRYKDSGLSHTALTLLLTLSRPIPFLNPRFNRLQLLPPGDVEPARAALQEQVCRAVHTVPLPLKITFGVQCLSHAAICPHVMTWPHYPISMPLLHTTPMLNAGPVNRTFGGELDPAGAVWGRARLGWGGSRHPRRADGHGRPCTPLRGRWGPRRGRGG